MKKRISIITLLVLVLGSISLNAKQLYFIRATIGEYGYQEIPPMQIIAYNPDADTLLRIYKDYTKYLPYHQLGIDAVEFYLEYNAFIFKLYDTGFNSYILYTNNPDTIIKMPTKCPKNYSVDPFLRMNIINGHWAYECSCNKKDVPDKGYDLFRGINFDLSNHFDLTASYFKDLYFTGVVALYVYLKPNDGHIYLPIVADIENRPTFSVELPQKYRVDRESHTVIYVNDNHKTIVLTKKVNPAKNEDYGHFYAALYNKDNDTWSDMELKGNEPTIMTYGHWLAGAIQDITDWDTKYFIRNKISPGKAVRDSVYMENSFDEQAKNSFYRPGILFLFNTDTQKYIEWETKQGDSEILLVQDEVVYYRVFNTIYKAPIINGEQLGKPELLVRNNEMVPYIHWAFFGKEMEVKNFPVKITKTILSDKAIIYSEPGNATKMYLIKGDTITVLEEKEDWIRMEYAGKKVVTGWVKKNDIK